MNDAELERLVRDLLDGRAIEWETLERTGSASRGSLRALRAVARLAESGTAAAAHAPECWADFELIEPIGHGGHGEVWRARDPQLDRFVALKILSAEDEQQAEDVLREGRLLARVRHPNVAAVYGVTRRDGEVGVAMEYVEGEVLDDAVRRSGPLAAREVSDIGRQLAHALQAVHAAGVLHRDVKASNVKRAPDGRIVLLDFGSSRELRAHSLSPIAEAGTPLYLAPEVLHGQEATVQSDVYSLGVLLHYLATGTYPVIAGSMEALRAAHAEPRVPRSGSETPPLPRWLASTIERMIARDPLQRPASAEAVASMLGRHTTRQTLLAAIAIGAVAIAAAAGIRVVMGRPQAAAPAPSPTARRLEWQVAPTNIGFPSGDGRLLPFVDRRNGALSILHTESGATDTLTSNADTATAYAGTSVLSSDGSRVVYQWHIPLGKSDELRLMNRTGGGATTLWRGGVEIRPCAWSQDGALVAVLLEQADDTIDLAVMRPTAGSIPVTLTKHVYAESASFSADRRFLVFAQRDAQSGASALWIADLATHAVRRLGIADGGDRTPIWWHETIVFTSERGGSPGLWAVGMRNDTGMPNGPPWHLSGGEAAAEELLGVTGSGTVIVRRGQAAVSVQLASLDGRDAQQLSSGPGSHLSPDWSPDGSRVAWIGEPGASGAHLLHLMDLRTRREDTLDTFPVSGGRIGLNPRFSPDGTRMILRGQRGFFVENLATREESAPFYGKRKYGDIEWDDDDHVFVLDFLAGVFRVDLRSGADERLYAVPAGSIMGRGIAVTPDKGRIAFVLMEGAHFETARILVMNRDGSAVRPLVGRTRTPFALAPDFAATPLLLGEWTPDGRELLFAATDILPSGFTLWNTDLWAVPGDGGDPRKTGLSAPGLRDVRPEPHGTRIAYTTFDARMDTWIYDGLLADTRPLR